ncbi:MAG TPA: CRISPR-associated helicase Cas3' [Actinobacteria bacterium]|nr:CRISPR-associated helicase Cas3' [Actinomycetota bacterium]
MGTIAAEVWAKALPDATSFHPLFCHALDTGAVARELAVRFFPDRMLGSFAEAWRCDLGDVPDALALCASLHDLGKAGPVFQSRIPRLVPPLRAAGFDFPPESMAADANTRFPHGVVGWFALRDHLRASTSKSCSAAIADLCDAIAGHHGHYGPPDGDAASPTIQGGERWQQYRSRLVDLLRATFDVSRVDLGAGVLPPAELVGLAAFVTVADWIASNEEWFPYRPDADPGIYAAETRRVAADVLDKELHWRRWEPRTTEFRELFGFAPNSTQRATMAALSSGSTPTLAIIEAPTGSGKTEAGLWLVAANAASGGSSGSYFALPTQAASSAMLGRIERFLAEASGEPVQLQLLHGLSAFDERLECLLDPRPVHVVDDARGNGEDTGMQRVVADRWFTARRRGLLSTFGVGTVDQALLAALPHRFFLLRLAGLETKTLIVDEVHAYDTYMSRLLDRLLEWLAAAGASVVLLSATLPERRRRELVAAYRTGRGVDTAAEKDEDVPYPRVTVSGERTAAHPIEWDTERTFAVDWCLPDVVVDRAIELAEAGGCVAVLRNTVADAQRTYQALLTRLPHDEVTLLHSRFPARERRRRERRLTEALGHPRVARQRPERLVVVATQVIEQSIDVDFDAMVTDLAPVDLIIQRAGRVHRHRRDRRPPHLERPSLVVASPSGRDLRPAEWIYDRWVLLRSRHVLRRHGSRLALPADTEALIGFVYDDDTVASSLDGDDRNDWIEARETYRAKMTVELQEAKMRWVRPPTVEMTLREITEQGTALEEAAALEVLTRLGLPSIEVVPVFATGEGPRLGSPTGACFDPAALAATRDGIMAVLGASIRVSTPTAYRALVTQPTPEEWKRSGWLSDRRIVAFRPVDGTWAADVDGLRFEYDPDPARSLGLVIGELS